MICRILLSLAAFALTGFVLLVLIGLWDGYEQETKALGFSGLYERYLASQAGFADDPKAYRAVVEAERARRSEEHTSELQSHSDLVCRLLLEKKRDSRAVTSISRL